MFEGVLAVPLLLIFLISFEELNWIETFENRIYFFPGLEQHTFLIVFWDFAIIFLLVAQNIFFLNFTVSVNCFLKYQTYIP